MLAVGLTESCSIITTKKISYYGTCTTLLGEVKACRAGAFLVPYECTGLQNDENCHFEMTETSSIPGKCISLGRTSLCQAMLKDGSNMIGFHENCE